MESIRIARLGAIVGLIAGAATLLAAYSARTTSCTTQHGSLEVCAVVFPSWAVYLGTLLVVASILVGLGAMVWRRSHPIPLP